MDTKAYAGDVTAALTLKANTADDKTKPESNTILCLKSYKFGPSFTGALLAVSMAAT